MWPASDDSQRHATMALKTLCTQTGATSAVCELLETTDGRVIGSWLLLDIDPAHDQRTRNLVHAFAMPVANCLAALEQRHRSVIGRVAHFVGVHVRTRVGWIVAALFGLAVAVMLVPVTHRIKCICRLEPVTHRFVAAPFEGTLEETLVELEFLKPSAPKQLMTRLRRLYSRTRMDVLEVNMMRGVLSSAQSWVKKAAGK